MSLVIAAIGAKALYLLYGWLASAIVANYVSELSAITTLPVSST